MSTLLIDNIGELVTNDPARRRRPLGLRRDAALVVEDGRVAWVGAGRGRARRPTRGSTPAGAAVLPGFVDSHAHLVFAGDRAAEFAARMAGEPYTGGGIRTTVAATRAGQRRRAARQRRAGCVAEALRQGTTTIEIKSGYGLTVADEARVAADRPASSPTRPPSSARTSCPPSTPTAPTTTSTWSAGRCWTPPRRTPRWVDVFCERGAFDGDQARAVLTAGAGRRARRRGCTPTSSAPARACSSPSSWARPAPTTAPT